MAPPPRPSLLERLRDPSERLLGALLLAPTFALLALIVAYVGVVKYMADDMLVMSEGAIVERGDSDAIYADPQHEYTKKLLSAVPKLAA